MPNFTSSLKYSTHLRAGRIALFTLLTSAGVGYANPTITAIDVPGATSTEAVAINDFGVITGTFADANGVHGFVRDVNANITPFDPPGSLGTSVFAINNGGKITGLFSVNQAEVGFLRRANGNFVTFGSIPGRTWPLAINKHGVISGVFPGTDTGGGFIRAVNGTMTFVNVQGAQYTSCDAINDSGEVAGNWFGSGPTHAYVRSSGELSRLTTIPGRAIPAQQRSTTLAESPAFTTTAAEAMAISAG
jgi:hypothetical protein